MPTLALKSNNGMVTDGRRQFLGYVIDVGDFSVASEMLFLR